MMIVRATLVGALCLLPMAGSAGAQSPDPVSPPACASRTDVLGISRIVEIDTAAGPRFGHQYKEPDFLEDGEVVLTFDDGPLRRYTLPILEALDAHCTKATFFAVGRMAIADPETLKDVARRGHTIGSHTWSHLKLKLTTAANATNEIELGLSAVSVSLLTSPTPRARLPTSPSAVWAWSGSISIRAISARAIREPFCAPRLPHSRRNARGSSSFTTFNRRRLNEI